GLAAALLGRRDQPLVFEQLQRRVDRTGAGTPHTAGALVKLLDHLVAVHRPLVEQRQDRGADVAAAAAPAPAPTAVMAVSRAERSATRPERRWSGRERRAEPTEGVHRLFSHSHRFTSQSARELSSVVSIVMMERHRDRSFLISLYDQSPIVLGCVDDISVNYRNAT